MAMNCPICGKEGEESEFKETLSSFGQLICQDCAEKQERAIEEHANRKARRESVEVISAPIEEKSELDEQLDAEYQEQLKKIEADKLQARIANYQLRKEQHKKSTSASRNAPIISKISGDLHCETCGGTNITKAGYMLTLDQRVQKWKCNTCGYVFTKYRR